MLHSIDKELLRDRVHNQIESAVRALFTDKDIEASGGGIRVGRQGSLSIGRRGANLGLWTSFEDGCSGDIFALIQYALGCDFTTALEWCESHVGSLPANYVPPKTKAGNDNNIAANKDGIACANRYWNKAISIKGTLAEIYLCGRGITVSCEYSLRFVPELDYFKGKKRRFPALLCAVRNVKGQIMAVHAIYLAPETGQKTQSVKPPKLSRGCLKGNAVYLGEVQQHAYICEGVEDGLSIMQLCPDSFVMATLGTSGMKNLILPPEVRKVTIACDNDGAGRKAGRSMQNRLQNEGYSVRLEFPPKGKDFNDFLHGRVK